MNTNNEKLDVIVVGAGMGGITSASLLANDGLKVLVLEASHVPGGCSSSYYRKGYTFESGATTLIGFDEHQPLRLLEEKLNVKIPKVALHPSMVVHQGKRTITRWQNRESWIKEVISQFGEAEEQRRFWELAFKVSDIVWKVSGTNNFFPPVDGSDWFKLFKNDLRDVWILPYLFTSVRSTASKMGITNPDFYQFLDEQLIISSQSNSEDTPFLFGAPAITYTNYTNYYVPGGLLEMVKTLQNVMINNGSRLHTKEKVVHINHERGQYLVRTSKKKTYKAPIVISNLPIWNMVDITSGEMEAYFKKEAGKYKEAWGAFTMGVATTDSYPENMPLHHQIHLSVEDKIEGLDSDSMFVSFSKKNDEKRAPAGQRVLNISTHTKSDYWFSLNGQYESRKRIVEHQILDILKRKLPHFNENEINLSFSSTPVSWSEWIYRKKGWVGGIPQRMSRSIFDWTPNKTPFQGLYLCGDTVFPGQGIPGVTLSGFNVYYRIINNFKKLSIH